MVRQKEIFHKWIRHKKKKSSAKEKKTKIAESLCSFTITRPDEDEEPHTIQLGFGFAVNDFLKDTDLVETFMYQKCGKMASKPICIRWKESKDLTKGLSAARRGQGLGVEEEEG